MRGFLNVLGGTLVSISVFGGIALFYVLDTSGSDPAMGFGLAAGAALSCLITAAILLGMAEGLRLLERIATHGEAKAVATGDAATPTQTAVRPPARPEGEVVANIAALRANLNAAERAISSCPQCKAEYRQGMTRCADCGVDLIVATGRQH